MGANRSVVVERPIPQVEPEELARAADLDVPVLVSGATAAERCTYARLLHVRSDRSEQPFIEVHCDRRSDPLARCHPVGIAALKVAFVRARGGTLFLDNVAALDMICQSWLCSHLTQVMMTGKVRLISGSDGSLADQVALGRFEPYLFYRLNVIHVDRA